jgi:hypothetical protein
MLVNLFLKVKFRFLFFLLLTIVFVYRIDSFHEFLLNIDEAEWIYCVKRCIIHPIPFLGFDSHTTGPISIYLITPLCFFDSGLSVVGLRIYGLLFMFLFSFLVFKLKNKKQSTLLMLVFTTFLIIQDKDFFAFNTEWILIPFIFLFVCLGQIFFDSPNKLKLFFLSLLNVILPLIKFQSVFIVFFIAFFIVIQLSHKKNFQALKWYVFFNFSIFFVSLLLIQITTGLHEFYYSYIARNIAYASTFATKPIKVVVIEYFYLLFKYFSYHLFFVCYLFFHLLFLKKTNFIHLISLLRFELLFSLVCLLTVFFPRNNFLHYYQFLFVPFTLLIVKLFILVDLNYFKNLLFLFSFFLIPFGIRSSENFYTKIIKGSSLNSLYYERVTTDGIQEISQSIPKKSSVFVFGWHKALPLYYNLRNSNSFTNPSGHSTFLLDLKENKTIYQNEKKNVLNVLRQSNVVVDAENVVDQLQDKEINDVMKHCYDLKTEKENYKIFVRKSN